MRICFIGDSFVNGAGDDACLGWAGQLCATARKAGHDLTLYNLGVRRDTSNDIVARWRQEAEARLPADSDGRLVFSFGTNDCCLDENGNVRVGRQQSLVNAEAILTAAKSWKPTLMIGPPIVGDHAQTDARVKILSEEFNILCAKLGLPYLDIFTYLVSCEPWKREAARGDGTHPNTEGYAALARLIDEWTAWRDWFPGL